MWLRGYIRPTRKLAKKLYVARTKAQGDLYCLAQEAAEGNEAGKMGESGHIGRYTR